MPTAQQVETELKKWGTSRGVRIPKSMCEYASIDIGSELTMSSGRDEQGYYITLRPVQNGHRSFSDAPMASMDSVFADYSGDYAPAEADWGEDAGAERMQ